MTGKGVLAVAMFGLMSFGAAMSSPAAAQGDKAPEEKGVKTSPLVTSLGAFRQPTSIPIVMSGQIVEIAPGGQTGRERTLVPSFLYVLEGTLTTTTEGGGGPTSTTSSPPTTAPPTTDTTAPPTTATTSPPTTVVSP